MLEASRANPDLVTQVVPPPHLMPAEAHLVDLITDGYIGDVLHVGEFFADDANSAPARVDSYQVANLRGGRRLNLAGVSLNAFVGVNNLFDEDYFSNVRINQSFNRFFEPAPGRHFYGGFAVRF